MEPRYEAAKVEPKIREFWEKNRVYQFIVKDEREVFSIDTPPPTVSGQLHLGHVFSYAQAEFVARYKRMRGYNVFYPFGLDNNGLPTELLIEKKLGIVAESMEREKFVELVKEEIKDYNQDYIHLFRELGVSADWSLLYETISDRVQRISQLSFLELVSQGRVYRKLGPVLFCPKERTTVSQMELKDKVLKSKLYRIKFSEKLVIATTRPELLPACVAVFVNPADPRYTGLVGSTVNVPLFEYEVKVYEDSRVDPTYGTGAVMCCTFGDQTDIEWFRAYNLELRTIIQPNGRLLHPVYGELKIPDAREKIVSDLRASGALLSEANIEHAVNVHERCDTEIEFVVRKQWYIRYLDLKDKFLELGRQVHWYPAHMRIRYENWVRGLQWDWNISRQRFFGVYFPLWYCANCEEPLFANTDELPVNPFSARPSRACQCGSSEFYPESDVMDTWATSSLTPLINAKWGEGDEQWESKIFPMSFRAQAHDIISFWAFTTIAKSFLHKGSIPWRDIMISGHGLDSRGQPMHKSKGNVMLPVPFISKYGADALRYWASSSTLGEDNSFQEKEVIAGSRLINKLWNLARYAEIAASEFKPTEITNVVDKWIMQRLNLTVQKATKNFDSYDYYKARLAVEEFFWTFADDYIEFVKDRVYAGDDAAKQTINQAIYAMLRLLAPFIPYVTEEIYQELFVHKSKLSKIGEAETISVHLSSWPSIAEVNQPELERGEIVAKTIREIRKLKHESRIPLNEVIQSATLSASYRESISESFEVIKSAIKVKRLEFTEHAANDVIVVSISR